MSLPARCLAGLAVLFLLSPVVKASAQDDDFLPSGSPATRAGVTAWCTAENSERGEFYLSAPRRLLSSSPMAVGLLSGHFAQTVNARFGMHLAMNAPHCQVFRTAAASESARSAIVTGASKRSLTIRDPGIF
ncbi:hypothetical protein GOB93_02970 [Acetobacter musti]|uniref:Uncharacterized protein n=1 Tax=Acetobacter musti TaxID=864732 RepID=A0ABX0JNG6_9PROT|nr:hypothetical protein [Acetobacter musti]NHN83602.1 hypothetical protein [Acetobacter musti]